jgi:hypothetical protein
MNSSLIGKIEKAHRYALQPERITFTSFEATFRGENDSHTVSLENGKWHCTCHFFVGWNVCSHTMAMEKILKPMLPEQAMEQDQSFAGAASS